MHVIHDRTDIPPSSQKATFNSGIGNASNSPLLVDNFHASATTSTNINFEDLGEISDSEILRELERERKENIKPVSVCHP